MSQRDYITKIMGIKDAEIEKVAQDGVVDSTPKNGQRKKIPLVVE